MAQAAFELRPQSQPCDSSDPLGANPFGPGAAAALDRRGFEIGWDHAHHRLTPPLRHLHDHNPVRQGWDSGRAAFGERTLVRRTAVRQWLALRLQAWETGQVFEGVQVTPHFLARIAAEECPVSRQPLTLGSGSGSDATISRLNLAAAYAAGNLVVLSQRVVAARAAHDSQDGVPTGGLSADEQARLAVLTSFATPLPHGRAAALALRVLPPNRVRVINPVQALQVMLTLQFTQAGYARRLLGLAALMPGSETRQTFQIFMHTLLARRLAVGPRASLCEMRQALEDSWTDALLVRRWVRLATRLSAADCELLLQRASQRALVVAGTRWVSSDNATQGWALESDGRFGHRHSEREMSAARSAPAVQAAAGAISAKPGNARSLGSQKLAS
jgi:hypothetical protein